MQRDKRIGLALAILLIGFATAFCFRPENGNVYESPQLDNPQAIDSQMASRGNVPYLTGLEDEEPEKVEDSKDQNNAELVSSSNSDPPGESHWEPYSFLDDDIDDSSLTESENPDDFHEQNNPEASEDRLASSPLAAPDPIMPEEQSDQENAGNTVKDDKGKKVWQSVSESRMKEDELFSEEEEIEELPTQNLRQESNTPQIHVVQSGDMLSTISKKYLGSSARYKEIYEANRDILDSPHDLQVGMKLKIPGSHDQNFPVASKTRQYSRKKVASKTGRKNGVNNASTQRSKDDSGTQSVTTNRKDKFVPVKRKLTQRKYKRSTTHLDDLISKNPDSFSKTKTRKYKVVNNKDDPDQAIK